MVIAMHDELDPQLMRLFATMSDPPADEEFTVRLMAKIDRARRARLAWQILAIGAVVVVAALNLRFVLVNTAAAIRLIGDLSPASTDLFLTPWGWAASMLIGAGLLLRFRPSRR
jgi:hypothetical protein